jgi:hypothetical protein
MRTPPQKPGLFRVTQLAGRDEFFRDFDAEEWSYEWLTRASVPILRMNHDNDPEATTSFEYVEFSAPVNVAFIPEE